MKQWCVQYQCRPDESTAWGPWCVFASTIETYLPLVERRLAEARKEDRNNPRIRYRLAMRVLPEWQEAA